MAGLYAVLDVGYYEQPALDALQNGIGFRFGMQVALFAFLAKVLGFEGLFTRHVPQFNGEVQYSSGTKSRISISRSQIMRVATDCTRPAERPLRTFRQRMGLIS